MEEATDMEDGQAWKRARHGRGDRHGRVLGMVEMTDMEEGQAWKRASHGSGDRHGRGSGT